MRTYRNPAAIFDKFYYGRMLSASPLRLLTDISTGGYYGQCGFLVKYFVNI